jgi:hypothetical protein
MNTFVLNLQFLYKVYTLKKIYKLLQKKTFQ